jgi:hypothetical protein
MCQKLCAIYANVNVKVKFTLEQATKAQRGVEVNSTLSLTSALYSPEREPVPIL